MKRPEVQKSPDRQELTAQAWRALDAGEPATAVRIWQSLANADDPTGSIGLTTAYVRLKDYAAAEATVEQAVRRFPETPQLHAHHAWVAQERGDWSEAALRWQAYRERFPADPIGHSALGVALRHLERFEEADATLTEGLRLHPAHIELLGNYAWVAHARGDWGEALTRWTAFRQKFPQERIGYSALGVVLRELGRFDEADAALREGLEHYADDEELLGNYAWVACDRHDWPEALRRWETYRNKFPDRPLGQRQVMWALGELGRFAEAEALTRPAALRRQPADAGVAALMLAFESLGGNCEFGVVQRHFGAEPLGLLRFTATPPQLLTAALRARFVGVGDPENTTMRIHNGAYQTGDARYHMSMHTFIRADKNKRNQIFANICRRLTYLREKLLGDLELAEKHFVFGSQDRVPEQEIRAMWEALREYGKNRLLFVQPADTGHPGGTVAVLEPDLVVGYLERLSVDDPLYDDWLALCRRAHRHWTPACAATPNPEESRVDETARLAVERHDGIWCIRDGAVFRPICNGEEPVAEFAAGWRPRFLYCGFAAIPLLELEHDDGRLATWFLNQGLDRVGGAVAELGDDARSKLEEGVRSLHRMLCDCLLTSPLPVLPSQLAGLSELNPETLAALNHLAGEPIGAIEWLDASDAAEKEFPQIRQTLSTSLYENYLKSLKTGTLTWPSPIDGRLLPCHSLYIDNMIILYRCVDIDLVFYICCAGHDLQTVGIFIPSTFKAYYLTERQKHSSANLFQNFTTRIWHYLIVNGHTLPTYFAAPCKKFLTTLWPENSFHIGHHLWNELSGLAGLVKDVPPELHPDVVVMGKPGLCEAYGKIDELFPELAARVRRGVETDAELTALACRESAQLMRMTGSYVSAEVRRRISALIAGDRRFDDERAAIDATRADGFTIVVLGLRVENRTVAGLAEFCARVVEHLHARLGRVAIVLDGHNTRLAAGDASTYPSFGEMRSGVLPADAERQVGAFIKANFAVNGDVRIIDNIGRSMRHSLLWAECARFFVSGWGAGLAKYRWAVNLPGVIWSSRWVLTQKGDLHIYDGDEFMEEPSRVRFLAPRHVFDIAEESVLVQIFEPHHPMYFNFKVNMKGIYFEIDRMIEELGLTADARLAEAVP